MSDEIAAPAMTAPEPTPIIKPHGVMIDIETLSTHPYNAVVLSIGAVKFSLTNNRPILIGPPFLAVLDLNAQIAAGREISVETQQFWREQSPEARKHWAEAKPVSVNDGLHAFASFIGDPELPIWANGICFDIGNLDSLYRFFMSQGVPWKYNAVRDARTMYRVIPEMASRKIPAGALQENAHDPIADCMNQIWGLWQHWPQFDE